MFAQTGASSSKESSTCEQGSDQSYERGEDRTGEAQPQLYPHLRGTRRLAFITALNRTPCPNSFLFVSPQLQGRAEQRTRDEKQPRTNEDGTYDEGVEFVRDKLSQCKPNIFILFWPIPARFLDSREMLRPYFQSP